MNIEVAPIFSDDLRTSNKQTNYLAQSLGAIVKAFFSITLRQNKAMRLLHSKPRFPNENKSLLGLYRIHWKHSYNRNAYLAWRRSRSGKRTRIDSFWTPELMTNPIDAEVEVSSKIRISEACRIMISRWLDREEEERAWEFWRRGNETNEDMWRPHAQSLALGRLLQTKIVPWYWFSLV